MRNWFANVNQHASEDVDMLLIGNKCDSEKDRVITKAQGQALADEYGVKFLETSAKNNINVEEAFFTLAKQIKKRLIDSKEGETGKQEKKNVDIGSNADGNKSGCC
ncbi:Ras-related protein Rab-8A [Zancudomyces culisetae]|uniref:Ras-related protein Rab-8A n=1 Tax=Zancudomyces culisetae TaxID=1213189 RepID=A0A1R1PIJ9_ZANCU|nr:Ras-related protein Rab-8A [Zancudomyces culisetae]|eukprot:OMH80800.1 Ras-related protein Rab-8A [Zancudomyces culisetae]